MKFARYLEETQTPEWKRAYIDYRGLKKRITAIRRAHEQSLTEPGSTPLLPLTPYPSTGSETHDRPSLNSNSDEAFGNTGSGSLRAAQNSADDTYPAVSPTVSHSNTGTSTGIFPRLRRRSTTFSSVLRSQTKTQSSYDRGDSVFGKGKLPFTPGSNPPLRELLPLLTPVQRAFFDKLDSELDKIESFFCARERELGAR